MLTLPDLKCVDLARHFLPNGPDDSIWSLALAIQETVEDSLGDKYPQVHQT